MTASPASLRSRSSSQASRPRATISAAAVAALSRSATILPVPRRSFGWAHSAWLAHSASASALMSSSRSVSPPALTTSDARAKQCLELSPKTHMVNECASRLEVDKQVHIARGCRCPPSDRAEHSDIRSTVGCRYPQDVGLVGTQHRQGQRLRLCGGVPLHAHAHNARCWPDTDRFAPSRLEKSSRRSQLSSDSSPVQPGTLERANSFGEFRGAHKPTD